MPHDLGGRPVLVRQPEISEGLFFIEGGIKGARLKMKGEKCLMWLSDPRQRKRKRLRRDWSNAKTSLSAFELRKFNVEFIDNSIFKACPLHVQPHNLIICTLCRYSCSPR
jgi:hypothetical protein